VRQQPLRIFSSCVNMNACQRVCITLTFICGRHDRLGRLKAAADLLVSLGPCSKCAGMLMGRIRGITCGTCVQTSNSREAHDAARPNKCRKDSLARQLDLSPASSHVSQDWRQAYLKQKSSESNMADRAIANEPSGEEQESMFETPERRRGEDDSDVGEINQAGIGVKPLELASTESRGGHMSVFIETVVVPKARSLLSAKMMADWIEASLVQSRNS
jgi:hypothetical protein